jgi:hypothetical protein
MVMKDASENIIRMTKHITTSDRIRLKPVLAERGVGLAGVPCTSRQHMNHKYHGKPPWAVRRRYDVFIRPEGRDSAQR